jgi:hypothetical protein
MRSQPTLAEQRAMATRMALRGIARQPGAFVEKAWRNLLHLVRPDGLQILLVSRSPCPPGVTRACSFSTTSSCCPRSCCSRVPDRGPALPGAG